MKTRQPLSEIHERCSVGGRHGGEVGVEVVRGSGESAQMLKQHPKMLKNGKEFFL